MVYFLPLEIYLKVTTHQAKFRKFKWTVFEIPGHGDLFPNG
jgi:hypothetical protein